MTINLSLSSPKTLSGSKQEDSEISNIRLFPQKSPKLESFPQKSPISVKNLPLSLPEAWAVPNKNIWRFFDSAGTKNQ